MKKEAEARLEAAIERVAIALKDKFDVGDIAVILREAVEIAEAFDDLQPTEKKALALAFMERLIDRFFEDTTPAIDKLIEDLDLPGPEWIEKVVWDPLLKSIAPKLLKPALKKSLPALVDLLVSAHNGELKLNPKEKPSA